ncbi:hypothetical protein ACFL2J_04775 [Candidatus Omnitrophota bacterium]
MEENKRGFNLAQFRQRKWYYIGYFSIGAIIIALLFDYLVAFGLFKSKELHSIFYGHLWCFGFACIGLSGYGIRFRILRKSKKGEAILNDPDDRKVTLAEIIDDTLILVLLSLIIMPFCYFYCKEDLRIFYSLSAALSLIGGYYKANFWNFITEKLFERSKK